MSELMMRTTDETQSPYPKSMLSENISKSRKDKTQFFYDLETKEEKKKFKKAKFEFDQSNVGFACQVQMFLGILCFEEQKMFIGTSQGRCCRRSLLNLTSHSSSISINFSRKH